MSPDSRQIELFVTVARHLSFSRAAAQLNIAQPWLSAQIRRLEEQLGLELFRRNSRHVELTEHGMALIDSGAAVIAALQAFKTEISTVKRSAVGTITIGAAHFSKFFPRRIQAIEDFLLANPGVGVDIEIDWSPRLRERVRSGAIDAAFTIGEFVEAGLEGRLVESHVPRLYMRADDPLSHFDSVLYEQLSGRKIITFPKAANPDLHDALYQKLASLGARLEQLPDTGTEMILRHISRTGSLAIAFSRSASIGSKGKIVTRALRPAPEPYKLFLVRRSGGSSALARKFWNTLFPEDMQAVKPAARDSPPRQCVEK